MLKDKCNQCHIAIHNIKNQACALSGWIDVMNTDPTLVTRDDLVHMVKEVHEPKEQDVRWVGKLDRRIAEEIFCNAKKAHATHMRIHVTVRPTYILVSFQDNGDGIPHNKFTSLGFGHSTSGGGHGIALIRSLIVGMGGTVTWDSAGLHGGTQVLIRFKRVLTTPAQ